MTRAKAHRGRPARGCRDHTIIGASRTTTVPDAASQDSQAASGAGGLRYKRIGQTASGAHVLTAESDPIRRFDEMRYTHVRELGNGDLVIRDGEGTEREYTTLTTTSSGNRLLIEKRSHDPAGT